MTFIADYPTLEHANLAANELNAGRPADAPSFEPGKEVNERGRYPVCADRDLAPEEVERLRGFLPMGGNHARF